MEVRLKGVVNVISRSKKVKYLRVWVADELIQTWNQHIMTLSTTYVYHNHRLIIHCIMIINELYHSLYSAVQCYLSFVIMYCCICYAALPGRPTFADGTFPAKDY